MFMESTLEAPSVILKRKEVEENPENDRIQRLAMKRRVS